MSIRYHRAPDVDREVQTIARRLEMKHIVERVVCVRSEGGKARWTLARCHAMSQVFAVALDVSMHYVIEIVAETFDRLDEEEKIKTLIHELLHVPPSFGGGLKGHRFVTERRVNQLYREWKRLEDLETRVERYIV